MAIDMSTMSRKELLQLQKDVAKALEKAELRAIKDARIAAEKAAAEFGFSLNEITDAPAKKKTVGAAKYRNPNNADETWTGRGRKPHWMIEAIAKGVDLSELEI